MNKKSSFITLVLVALLGFALGRVSIATKFSEPSKPDVLELSQINTEQNVRTKDKSKQKDYIRLMPNGEVETLNEPSSIEPSPQDITLENKYKALEAKYDALIGEKADLLKRLATLQANNNVNTNLPVRVKLTKEDVSDVLSAPFDDFVLSSGNSLSTKFKQLQTQKQDVEWALEMQQRIADFFITHEYGYAVELRGVNCKQSMCDIRGFEREAKSLNKVMRSIRAETWWAFNSTHSSSRSDKEYGQFFYMIVSNSKRKNN